MIELKAYEGLIRNHAELASELGIFIEGCTRREREQRIVCAAYEKWGVDAGAHINGQFAIALFDTDTNTLFCTRDILGAELLFYYPLANNAPLVGTQISDLFDQPGFVRELNTDIIQFYLAFNYVPGELTLFKGVSKLAPGGYLTYCDGALQLGRFWEMSFEPDESKTIDEWANDIEGAMEASLASILDEGEQVDSFLSGGVDSSYILAKSRAKTGLCVAYADQKVSEEAEARETANYLGRDFKGIEVTPQDFFGTVDEFLLAFEQPTADVAGLTLYAAAKKVKGFSNLCFSGEGADEFFAGYSVYKNRAKLRHASNPIYFGSTYIMDDKEQSRYLKCFNPSFTTTMFMKDRSRGSERYDDLGWMLYTELKTYFEGSILFNSTKISRGTGLEIRMPFCDLRMFEIARHMPSRFKYTDEGNKLALRRAASRVLPEEVAYRKKLGFPVPVRAWLADSQYNGDIKRAFKSEAAKKFFDLEELDILLSAFLGKTPRKHLIWFKRRPALIWRYVWTIYTFIRWYELFFEENC